MRKSVLNTALSTAFIVTLGFGISACSSEKESAESDHILAVDRVDDAAALARKNAPAAEDMDFPATAPMPAVDATTDAAATEAGVATAEPTTADATAIASADSTDTTVATADQPATDAAAADAPPATN